MSISSYDDGYTTSSNSVSTTVEGCPINQPGVTHNSSYPVFGWHTDDYPSVPIVPSSEMKSFSEYNTTPATMLSTNIPTSLPYGRNVPIVIPNNFTCCSCSQCEENKFNNANIMISNSPPACDQDESWWDGVSLSEDNVVDDVDEEAEVWKAVLTYYLS